MKMENITGFMLVFGAVFIVAIIIFKDIFKKEKSSKPFMKWFIVLILSLWQIVCWRALNGLGTSFGNSGKMANYEIVFIIVVVVWFLVQVVSYFKNRKKVDY